jgi:hypothetical protein
MATLKLRSGCHVDPGRPRLTQVDKRPSAIWLLDRLIILELYISPRMFLNNLTYSLADLPQL